MSKGITLGLGCWLLLGCGGAPPPQPPPAPPPPVASAAPTPTLREPSAKLRRYLAVDRPRLVLYADLEALFQTELVEQLLPAILDKLGDLVTSKKKLCMNTLAENARELVVADGRGGTLVVVGFKTGGLAASRTVCLGSLVAANKVEVKGTEEAYASEGGVIALEPDVVVAGYQPKVEMALAGPHEKEWPGTLALKPGEQLVWKNVLSEPDLNGHGSLSIDAQRFLLAGDFDFADEAMAKATEARVADGRAAVKAMLGGGENQGAFDELLNALSVKRDGKRLAASFELRGTPSEVANRIGVVAALGTLAARKYMVETKNGEARANVPKIAAAYAASFAEPAGAKPGARPKKKLESLPPVPAAVPIGQKYQSTEADWTAWAKIGFSLQGPQYYQYEVVAAKDGKSADVIAKGDLDGDGEFATFRVKLTLDPKTQSLATGGLEESQPAE